MTDSIYNKNNRINHSAPKCIYCEESVTKRENVISTDFGLAHEECFLEI
ncbi:hypothetical protein [Selenihalanaerobacter shriftii]|uniref:Uncharacterized protein n=1 Tax=Selenihalanaerobacter shriftii TaxID=142842 RepID=A0A1T4Q964_9FIRM|nr:hypothetical protein [Selenihalanaerobacter shriftii]SKA00235.1 hypothetical protein SAMN02745118_02480 [Selenihalanaerobacter shriftii]